MWLAFAQSFPSGEEFIFTGPRRSHLYRHRGSEKKDADSDGTRPAVEWREDTGAESCSCSAVPPLAVRAMAAGCTARSGKLYRARSRLYRNQILQENMRLNSYLVRKEIESSR